MCRRPRPYASQYRTNENAMKAINIPSPIQTAFEIGADLAISISGGKDSQAMLSAVTRWWGQHAFTGSIYAIHADLGRAEWQGSLDWVRQLAAQYGIDLVVVEREKGDLVDRITDRYHQDPSRPFWPSASNRYCTSDLKRDPINKYLRRNHQRLVVSAEGIRAQESRARASKPCWEPRKRITTRSRDAYTWRPILNWTEEDVWAEIGTTLRDLKRRRALYRTSDRVPERAEYALKGWPAHPAYVYGNERLSCALCVLASKGDLINGLKHNPALAETYIRLEKESGFSFKKGLSLTVLQSEIKI